MVSKASANIVFGRELAQALRAAESKEGALSEERKAAVLGEARKERVAEFRERFANPYIAAERVYVDAVIRPRETRRRLIRALEMLDGKRDSNPPRKHGNIPL